MGITSPTSTTGQILKDGTAVISFDSNNNATFAGTVVSNTPLGMRNRIINGDMSIDQRNAGASVTGNDAVFGVDRWKAIVSQSSKFTMQQNAGSVTPPSGFTNYFGCTSSSAYTVGSAETFNIAQFIEGFNTADLAWGTANARTVTLSFWVRSSLTGTFSGSLSNSAVSRSYPFSYTISSANTWEQKSVTIAGATSGTWVTNNGIGIRLYFSLGTGSTLATTAGSWASGFYLGATGATSVVGTNGATFYITGVQLEVGSSATPFERRMYGQELALCQRYYYKWINDSTGTVDISVFQAYATGSAFGKLFDFPVTMRATPTGTASATFRPYSASASFLGAFTNTPIDSLTKQSAGTGAWTGSSGMSAGSATGINVSVNGFVAVSAEL